MLYSQPIVSPAIAWQNVEPARFDEATQCAPRFLAQLDGALKRLSGNRLRFSLMRLILPPEAAADVRIPASVAELVAGPYVMGGLWRDGSIVAAFLGPRSGGSAGDRTQGRKIVQLCREAILAAGEAELIPQSSLLITHCWTDEVVDVATLVDGLKLPGEIGT